MSRKQVSADGRDQAAFSRMVIARLSELGHLVLESADAESALACVTHTALETLGDEGAHLRPGALKPGERQFRVSGVFLVTPDESGHVLVAEHGFPAEQHRLAIPIDLGHPGWMYQNRVPLILPDTDDSPSFRQILKTARMGSALYAPLICEGRFVGQLVTAAQARGTFGDPDRDALVALSALASLAYAAHDGDGFCAALGDASPAPHENPSPAPGED